MSFGWSAGDIAQAITLIVKVAKALDSVDGAAGDYREAISFLQCLRQTLEPLKTFTALGTYPSYKEEIRQHVESIRGPIESFLATATKFDHSLGPNAKAGHHRHISRKLLWRFIESKAVDKLKSTIDGHMRVLEILLQRLTLDIVWTVQNSLRGEMRAAFADILDAQLIGLLGGQLQPLRQELQEVFKVQSTQLMSMKSEVQLCQGAIQDIRSKSAPDKQLRAILSRLDGQDVNLKSVAEAIKQHLSTILPPLDFRPDAERQSSSSTISTRTLEESTTTESKSPAGTRFLSRVFCRESLTDVYYLVFLSLAQFLRHLFIYLATLVRPSRALTPALLAKYNISFYDAIGRPPRILDYSCFVSYRVFQAFLHDSFTDRPGAAWVERELYRLSNARNGQVITPRTWSKIVAPGSHVQMSMIIPQTSPARNDGDPCPGRHCKGFLQQAEGSSLRKCSECDMEVLDFQIESLASSGSDAPLPSSNDDSEESAVLENQKLREVEFLDILHFKRVVRSPLSDIHVLPKQPNPNVMTQIFDNGNSRSEPILPKVTEQLSGKDLPQIFAPQPRRVWNEISVEERSGKKPTLATGPNPVSKGTKASSVEIFKSFRVSMDDPCYKVLPAALKKYNINASWEQYALYVVYGNRERCLGMEEKPLIIFKQLDKEGLKPMFMLRKLATHPPANFEANENDDASSLSYLRNPEGSLSTSEIESWPTQSQEETSEKLYSPPHFPARLRRPERIPRVSNQPNVKTLRIYFMMTDTCSTIISIALKSQDINKPWLFYNLFIVYEGQEYLVASEEEPMPLFMQLVLEGKDPVFMLRKKYAHDETTNFRFLPDKVDCWEGMRSIRNKRRP